MEELYYSHPVQVRYWNTYYKRYMGAIVYHEFLIDGRCGKASLITDILQSAAEYGKDSDKAIIELDWIAIDAEILGTN